jgi:hypoxanthine phosphoribosyltransferase
VNAIPADVLLARERAEVLFDREAVDRAVDQLSIQLTLALADANPIVLCVMNGGLSLTGDLLGRFSFALELDYLHATRYANTTAGGELSFRVKPQASVAQRTVLVVDDILDRGHTLAAVVDWLDAAGAAEVLTSVLVDKQLDRPRPVAADYAALEIPDRYVFGRGMDYHGYWRNLGEICALPDDFEGE